MRRLAMICGVLLAVVAAFWVLAPREELGDWAFDPGVIGEDVVGYLARQEARFDDITPGTEKRVIWAEDPGQQTEWAVIYVHGFSATSEEIRPVPDKVAEGLRANLVYTRLAGHGRGGAALAQARAGDWLADYAEAVAVARRVGRRVLVIATSTGATLATIGATEPGLDVDAIAMVSPNFGVTAAAAQILTWPGARLWAPLVAGRERSFSVRSEAHGRYWTARYPTVALLPMAALVAEAAQRDVSEIDTPLLALFSEGDQVVQASKTRAVAARWGGPVVLHDVTPGPGDDPMRHVIAGDIMSPGMTEPVTNIILDWAADLGAAQARR